jgi:hypothetical protein
MKYALASAIFSTAATIVAAELQGLGPAAMPAMVFMLAIDVVLFFLGRRDASSMADLAANEVEAAEYKALVMLVVLLFALSVLSMGYFLVAELAPGALQLA